jgi:hypothetical protein
MDNFEKQEKEIKGQFDQVELVAFEEKFSQIESRLDMGKPQVYKKRRFTAFYKLLTAAASVVLVAVGTFVTYLSLRPGEEPPVFRYEDANTNVEVCQVSALTSIEGLYLPNLTMLEIQTIEVGRHIETNENVYFSLTTTFDDGFSFREIEMIIILKAEYNGTQNKNYNDLSESLNVGADKTIQHSLPLYEEPFYACFVQYTQDNIRYCFNYKTIEENDLNVFFGEFLV